MRRGHLKQGRKVTKRQEWQLVQIFLHMGQDVAGPVCVALGVSPRYAKNRVTELGLLPPRKNHGGGNIALTVDHTDPRWKWAEERGPVLV